MSEVEKKILERSSDGDYKFTNYGEFLSYYHAHLQLFKKFLQEKKVDPVEAEKIYQRIKGYMVNNIKTNDHFFEKSGELASFLSVSTVELTTFLNSNFLESLAKVQAKLKDQELAKMSSKSNFSGISEEILFLLGDIFPAGSRFIFQDGLLVIEEMATGKITKPTGILSEIKEAQEKQAQEKLEKVVRKEKPVAEQVYETSILVEIFEKLGNHFTGERLELKQLEPEVAVVTIIPKDNKPKGILDDVEELSLEETAPEMSAVTSSMSSITRSYNAIEDDEPGILDDIEEYDSKKEEEEEPDDLSNFLDEVESPELSIPKPDVADEFTYKSYSEINKIIQGYKSANDLNGYNSWLQNANSLEKSFVGIRNNLSKEKEGNRIDWNSYFNNISDKTGYSVNTLQKLKLKISHLDKTKQFLDITITELKKQPPEVLQILKSAWPHILETFNLAPDYPSVETKLKDLLSRIKTDSQRLPIEKILNQAITKLKTIPFQ
ncbi:MAG: hypothetical protein SFU98_01095 [Leptospiraceae bacterium]|nr:hypothetical protein [Leptospiraceae bacterium]